MKRLLPIIPALLLIFILEISSRLGFLPGYLVPAPSAIAECLIEDSSELWQAFGSTFFAAGIGFLIAGLAGVLIGSLFSLSNLLRRAFFPYAIFFQTVPIIAIAPLLVIWMGYGIPTVVSSALIVSIFPMIASTLSGIKSTDTALIDLFKLYRANRWQRLWSLQLPFALPNIFVGLRITAGLSVIGAIVGEFIAGGGLGGMIDVARTRQRIDQVFACILLASLIGLLYVFFVSILSRRFLRHWHASEIQQ